jgi:hypothetical protein
MELKPSRGRIGIHQPIEMSRDRKWMLEHAMTRKTGKFFPDINFCNKAIESKPHHFV